MISENNHRLKSCRSCLHFNPAVLKWKTLRDDCGSFNVEKLEMPFFFSITLIYISQSPFIKTLKKGVTRTPISRQPTDIKCNLYMRCFCAGCAHFESHFGIVLMSWSLVCACWQSVRNICFGRCCGHMIPSIHKVPACPFTALYTVSHCTDDRTMITFPAFTVQCITYKQQFSTISCLFYISAAHVLFRRRFFTISVDFLS